MQQIKKFCGDSRHGSQIRLVYGGHRFNKRRQTAMHTYNAKMFNGMKAVDVTTKLTGGWRLPLLMKSLK